MPYAILPVKDGFKVVNTTSGKVHAKHTTHDKAEAQVRLLMAAEHKGSHHSKHADPPKDPHKFAQAVTSAPGFRHGAFTKKAEEHHKKPLAYMREVLAHPGEHDLRTRREAQFLHNIQRKK